MPVYNGARYLSQAIESILAQSYSAFEFLIVDDGSTDASADIADEYAASDARVRVIRIAHQGNGRAAEIGLLEAKGPFVARMDSDDIAEPQRFEKQVAFLLENPDVAVVGSAVRIFYEGDNTTHTEMLPTTQQEIRDWIERGHTPISNPTSMMRKAEVMTVGGVRPQFTCANDYDLWLRVVERYQIANLPEILLNYRIHGRNISKAQRYEQSICMQVAKLSADARAQGKPDPVEGWQKVELAHIEAFDLAPSERIRIYIRLAKKALRCHAITADARYLRAAETCLAKLGVTTGRVRRIGMRLAWRNMVQGDMSRTFSLAKWCLGGALPNVA
jgi:glycosyltransferase involved in cell wall biosynthesis